ncbi:MAG TPA: AAA family ATPase [Streptosporangiaceae bacterium]
MRAARPIRLSSWRAITQAVAKGATDSDRDAASDELRTYMMMLLVAAPLLIDIPVSRSFLEQAQALGGEMAHVLVTAGQAKDGATVSTDRLDDAVKRLRAASDPLLQVLDPEARTAALGGESELPAALLAPAFGPCVGRGSVRGWVTLRKRRGYRSVRPARLPPSLGRYGRVGVERLGDFEEVERLQAGIREWLRRTGRSELHQIPASAVLPLLCAAAFGPALADAADLSRDGVLARIGVLSSVGAGALSDVLARALDRARSAHPSGDLSRTDLQREIARSMKEVLSAADERAAQVRSDVAMVLREIDAGGTVFRAAIEVGDEELQREVLAAVEAVSSEFGEMEFMLADLSRAAGEIQDSLSGQGTELRTTSEQVGRQSADVRMIREELAVIEQRTRQWIPGSGGPGAPGPSWSGCPYRGLLPYDQAHAAVFFGRDRLTAELAGLLAETGLVVLTGASGAGKTSLLQAGLVPALARGVQVPGSSSWPRVGITPGARPLADLSAGLAQLSGHDPDVVRKSLAEAPGEAQHLVGEIVQAAAGHPSRLVLIIDQFEQIFAAPDDLERASFIDAVCAAAARPAGPRGEPAALAVIAVRGDYWDRCAAYPQLARAMQHDQLVIGPMAEADLRRVITGPAAASGLRIEAGLTDAILADLRSAADGAVGALPLLSQAMMLTWEQREGDQLTRRGYEGPGGRAGVARSVEASAEAAYAGLTEDQKTVARDVFRQLTAVGPDRRPTRRAASTADLRAARSEGSRVEAVLEAFARSRLLVLDAGQTEIAHDVLLQAWPRLRGWLEEDQASMILHGQLAEDTARWAANGNDSSLLYQGVQLTATRQAVRVWEADPDRYPALTPDQAGFLRASGRALTRGAWRRRALAGLAVLVVIAALVGAGIAVRNARTTADQQRTADVAQRLAAQSTALDATDPVTASLLAAAAWRLAPTGQARYSLLESLAQPVRGVLSAQSGVVTALAYSPDGSRVAAGYQDGAIRLWDLASHHLISETMWGAEPLALAFTSGGRGLRVADATAVGSWNLATRPRITALPLAGVAGGNAVAFSLDGTTVATGGTDGNVRLWNAATRQEIGAPMSSDAQPVDAVALSPDGTLVAAASSDGNVQLWTVATQQEAGAAMVSGTAEIDALAFSPDGKILATGGQDGAARLWNVSTETQAGATMATGDAVGALTFGTGGTTLATAESDDTTELWNVTTQTQTGAALTAQGSAGVSSLAFSPSADALATGNSNGTIELWSPAVLHQPAAPLAIGAIGTPAASGHAPAVLSASGRILAVSDGRGTVRVWDVTANQPVGVPLAGYRTVTGLALSPDGGTLAVAGRGVQLWRTATGQRIGAALPASGGAMYGGVAFSPDASTLATIGADGTARLWNVATQQETGAPMTVGAPGTFTGTVAFSPHGKILVTVGAGGQTQLWNVATQQRLGKPMAAGAGTTVLAFSADGATLATAGGDGSVRLWDVATQQEIGTSMTADAQPVYAAAFSPDGATLATASGDGTGRTWDVAFPASLTRAACAIADVSLTPQQWADYAGTQPFQQVCPAN